MKRCTIERLNLTR